MAEKRCKNCAWGSENLNYPGSIDCHLEPTGFHIKQPDLWWCRHWASITGWVSEDTDARELVKRLERDLKISRGLNHFAASLFRDPETLTEVSPNIVNRWLEEYKKAC